MTHKDKTEDFLFSVRQSVSWANIAKMGNMNALLLVLLPNKKKSKKIYGFIPYLERVNISLGLDIIMCTKHSGQTVTTTGIYRFIKQALNFIECPHTEGTFFLT
jgi:hypothetical protein